MIKKIREWIESLVSNKEKAISFLDSLDLDQAIMTFESLQKFLWIVPCVVWGIHVILLLVPVLNTLNFQFILLLLFLVCVLNIMACLIINRYLFYFYSRQPKLDPVEKINTLWSIQKVSDLQSCITEGAIVGLPVTFTILPYLEFLRLHPSIAGWTTAMTDQLSGNPLILRVFIFTLPVIATFYFFERVRNQERQQKKNIDDWMGRFQYHKRELHSVLSNRPKETQKMVSPEPYLTLGTSILNGDIVEQAPVNRLQNACYFGPVGAGKTSTIFIPQIKQDIDHYLRFIRDYPKISRDPDFMKRKGNIATRYLNGLIVIETSNDLCASVYDLAIKMGVPKEKITWIDPSNPESPALNLLRGPVDTVVETVTNIIAGVKADNNDFFKQSERSHLKNFIFLLKLSCVVENKIATFTDLMALYNDIYVVVDRMKVLDKYVQALKTKMNDAKADYDANPDSKAYKTRYQEIFDKYEIAYGTSQWFHNNIKVATFGQGVLKQKSGPHEGEVMYVDEQAENVQGLKNSLDDLSKNQYLRRVLFRDSGDFNFDDQLRNGGIILCNTAKAELQDQLAGRLGQIYLMSFQSATFRRMPNRMPLFALYCDEFPDFISEAFKSFVSQARKYSVSTTICAQSPSQLSYSFGPDFFNTLMTTMLTRGTFGDLGASDAKLLEPFFGEHSEVEESINEQQVDLTADQNSNRKMISARRQTVPNITANEIMSLPKFTIALRHPNPQGSVMFDLIKTHYLKDEDIANDPNIFDIHNSRDYEAFEDMMAHAYHGNADFDKVDLEIIDDIKSGKIEFRDTGKGKKTHKTVGASADDDLKNLHQKHKENSPKSNSESDNKFVSNDSDTQNEQGVPQIFSDFDPDDSGPDLSLVHQGESNAEKRSKFRALASEAVNKTLNHSGQNRLDNGVEQDEHLPTTKSETQNNESADDNTDFYQDMIDNISTNDTSEKPNEEVSEKDMIFEKDGNLYETKKDRSQLHQQQAGSEEAQMKAIRNQTLHDLERNIKDIQTDSALTNAVKLDRLKKLYNKNYEQIVTIWPKDHDRILNSIKHQISKMKTRVDSAPAPINKDDNLDSIMKKSREAGSNQALADELSKMLDDFEDRPVTVVPGKLKDIADDGFINSSDPFNQQHGMDDE